MNMPDAVWAFLHRQNLPFQLPEQGESRAVRVRTVLLQDRQGPLLALHDAARVLDITILRQTLRRDLEPAGAGLVGQLFKGCDPGALPALPQLYGLPAVVDSGLFTDSPLELPVGSAEDAIRVEGAVFRSLLGSAHYHGFAHDPPPEEEQPDPQTYAAAAATRLRERIRHIRELPAMPEISHRILQLRINPRARASDLAVLVEADPSLAAQVIRRATSSLYGYRGRIDSVRDAIVRVLGFDQVMRLAMGIAIHKSFRVPQGGQQGLHVLWRNSMLCSALVSSLVKALPRDRRPTPGLASLAGLFHNFGRLLLGHSFPSDFALLNRFLAVNEHLPLYAVERYVVGVEDPHLGAWLMQAWNLPEEVITAVRWHHRPAYRGIHCKYAGLVCVANRLLKRRGIGEASQSALPEAVLQDLGLGEAAALRVLEDTLATMEGLDRISRPPGP